MTHKEDAQNFGESLAAEFVALLDSWHAAREPKDAALDSQIHRWYVDPPQVKAEQPFFSPSSALSDMRELYFKGRGFDVSEDDKQAHQGRWVRIGTAIGDIIQRDLLFIEKHGERVLGEKPRFRFVRTPSGAPLFEEFATKTTRIERGGVVFRLHGSPDGIMLYEGADGKTVRVGLEIKSKQTTPARTSLFSMKGAEDKHIAQSTAYAIMHDCDYYLILYVNAAHKSWVATEADAAATPDIRCFCIEMTDERKGALLDRFAYITKAIDERRLPPFDLTKWRFNGLKAACALSLSEAELGELAAEVAEIQKSKTPTFLKKDAEKAYAEILEIRRNFPDETFRKKVYEEVKLGIK